MFICAVRRRTYYTYQTDVASPSDLPTALSGRCVCSEIFNSECYMSWRLEIIIINFTALNLKLYSCLLPRDLFRYVRLPPLPIFAWQCSMMCTYSHAWQFVFHVFAGQCLSLVTLCNGLVGIFIPWAFPVLKCTVLKVVSLLN